MEFPNYLIVDLLEILEFCFTNSAKRIAACFRKHGEVLVIGSRSSGKSSFVRAAWNESSDHAAGEAVEGTKLLISMAWEL